MIFPALEDALLDRRLSRNDLLVYGAILGELDPRDYRAVPMPRVATVTGMQVTHIRRSLRRLAALGYLDRGDTDARGFRTFAFYFSRPVNTRGQPLAPPKAA